MWPSSERHTLHVCVVWNRPMAGAGPAVKALAQAWGAQVLAINAPFVWTEEPLTGHRGGSGKHCCIPSNFSPLKGNHEHLWQGATLPFLSLSEPEPGCMSSCGQQASCVGLQNPGVGRLSCLAQWGSGMWHTAKSTDLQKDDVHVLRFILTPETPQRITLEEGAGLFTRCHIHYLKNLRECTDSKCALWISIFTRTLQRYKWLLLLPDSYLLLNIDTKWWFCLVNVSSNFSSYYYLIKTYFLIKQDCQLLKHCATLQ